jgi:TonB-dependent starch-binding outer membrane protein SusC
MKRGLLLSLLLAFVATCCFSLAQAQEVYASASQARGEKTKAVYKPLKKVMQDLRDKRGIYFMFNNKNIQQVMVNANVKEGATIEEVLDSILTPVGLTYKKVDNIYVILEKANADITPEVQDRIEQNQAQGNANDNNNTNDAQRADVKTQQSSVLSITGHVISELGEDMPGVNVVVKGTTIGTVTDATGRFTLEVADGAGTLVLSFIGYLTQEVPLMDRTTVDVQMQPDITTLGEIVVVGYGTQKRAEVTSSVATVKADQFRQTGARSAMDLVQGKVAGLTVTRVGGSNPNTSVSMSIRGVTSISGTKEPLVVIDGIPGGNLDLLQQDDIESIDVLKDGSAAAIYGTQANGGVILVTTKKGKAGASTIDYSTYFRKEYVQRRPDFMTADEYRARVAAGEIAASADDGFSIDGFDELVNHSNLTQYHNLALTGGSENTNYRASITYQDLQGIARENSREQYGLRFNVNQKAFDGKLLASMNLATNFNNANLLGGGTVDTQITGGGWENVLIRDPRMKYKNADGTWFFQTTNTNELARLEQETSDRQQQTTSLDGKVSFEPIPGLKGSMFGSVQRNYWIDGAYKMLTSESSVEHSTPEWTNGGHAIKNTEQSIKYAFEPTIEYNRKFNTIHNVTLLGGYSWRYEVYEGFKVENAGFMNDRWEDNSIGQGTANVRGKAIMSGYKNDNTLIAFFGRVSYSLKDKYMAQFILRREGSSRFGNNNKWGNFPAASVGWNISRESFMQGANFLDDLKLRVGYGVTGNAGFANYASKVTLSAGNNYGFPGGVWRQTYGPSRNPNPNLRWEKKQEWNFGLDFALFNNRLTGMFDVYSRRTVDLIGSYTTQLPAYITESINANVGTIASKGIELTLSGTVISKTNFQWKMDIAASHANNKMESFSDDLFKVNYREFATIGGNGALGFAIRTFEGGAIGAFYGKRFAGFTEDGKWLFYKRDGTAVPASQITNSADPNQSDFAIIGNAIPKYYLSWANTFTYKNFDLRVFMRGRFGYEILNTMEISYGTKAFRAGNLLNSAFEEHAQLNDTYQYSDYYLENGNFFKLDEVTLGYNFKLESSYLRNLRVYVAGQNLAILTGYKGNDPDYVQDTGVEPGVDGRGPYPSTRSFMVGLNVGF